MSVVEFQAALNSRADSLLCTALNCCPTQEAAANHWLAIICEKLQAIP